MGQYHFLDEWIDKIVVVKGTGVSYIDGDGKEKESVQIPQWDVNREQYLYNGTITDQNLRQILPGEIVIEFDAVKKDRSSEFLGQVKSRSREQIEKIKTYLTEQGVFFYVTDHGGLSPHIRFNIKGLGYFPHKTRKSYKYQFVERILQDTGFKTNDYIQLDNSLINTETKLISLELQPHWKKKYGGAIEEIKYVNEGGKKIEVNKGTISDIIEAQKVEVSLGNVKLNMGNSKIAKMLDKIPADDRDVWWRTAVGLKHQGIETKTDLFPIFDKWSAKSQKYKGTEDCKRLWDSFDIGSRGDIDKITLRTVVYYARVNGWNGTLTDDEEGGNKSKRIIFNPRTLETMYNEGIPEIEWHIWRILPKRGITFLGGASGSYKTWAAMHLALSVAQGKEFLFKYPAYKARVLYLDEENGDISLFTRFQLLAEGYGLERPFDNLHVATFSGMKLDMEDHMETLDQYIEDNNIKVVVIDSMVRCMIGQEDKATEVRLVFDNLKSMMEKRTELSFVLLHHTKKGAKGMDALRGSGDFAAFADIIFMFNPIHKKKIVEVDVVKHRHLDLSTFQTMNFEINNPESGGITLAATNDEGGAEADAVKECAEEMLDYLKIKGLTDFATGGTSPLFSEMMAREYTRNQCFDAIKLLSRESIISKYKTGKAELLKQSFDEEIVEVAK